MKILKDFEKLFFLIYRVKPLLFTAAFVARMAICFDFEIFCAYFKGGFTSIIFLVAKFSIRLGVLDATTMISGENLSCINLIDLCMILRN